MRARSTLVGLSVSDFGRMVRESNGAPFVFDDGDRRTLHFEAKYVQSEMRLSAPDELVLSYTRAMMGFLLFKQKPRNILMVGLGGGSLVKFCHRYLRSTQITVIEINADVIALRDKFMVPADDERLQVVHADAVDYIVQSDRKFDVLMLDGFTADGQPAELSSERFYAACRRRLVHRGVLVANLTGYDPNFTLLMTRFHAEFGNQMWWGQAADSNNGIVFVVKNRRDLTFIPPLLKRALRLDQQYNLGLLSFAARMQTTAANEEWLSNERQINIANDTPLANLERLAETVKVLLFIANAQGYVSLQEELAKLDISGLKSAANVVEKVIEILSQFSTEAKTGMSERTSRTARKLFNSRHE